MSQSRNWNASVLTTKKATRAVFANNLAQNTAVNAGTRLAVTGQSSTSNSFTLAIENGSTDLTPAEYASVIDANTPSYGPPAITFERGVNPMTQNQYTILPGYTSIAYTLIGGGGGGGGTAGGGGGAGGAIIGTFQAIAGNVIKLRFNNVFNPVSQGTGGAGGVDTNKGSNGDSIQIILYNNIESIISAAAGGGGIGGALGIGGGGGEGDTKAPVGSYIVYAGNNGENKVTNGGNGGTLGGGLTFAYGGGGGGAGDGSAGGTGFNGGTAGTNTNTGGNGGNPYYKIVIT